VLNNHCVGWVIRDQDGASGLEEVLLGVGKMWREVGVKGMRKG